MRTTSTDSPYYPIMPPSNPAQLPQYLVDELLRLSTALTNQAALLAAVKASLAPSDLLRLTRTTAPPAFPTDGDIRHAAGPGQWDPGSGEGFYGYDAAAGQWKLLG